MTERNKFLWITMPCIIAMGMVFAYAARNDIERRTMEPGISATGKQYGPPMPIEFLLQYCGKFSSPERAQ